MALGSFNNGLGFGMAFILADKFTPTANKINKSMSGMEKHSKKTANAMSQNFASLGKVLGAIGIGATFGSAISKAAAFSDQLIDVSKATGLTSEGIESLRTQLEGLDTRRSLPELLKLSELGGQLGATKAQLLDFTKVADQVGLTLAGDFGGSAEQATKQLVQLGKKFRDTKDIDVVSNLRSIGSAINEMGNIGATNTKNVADFANRVAAFGKLAPTAAQTIGLGAALDELGFKTRTAASAFKDILRVATSSPESMGKFASQLGVTSSEFQNIIDQDPNRVMLDLAKSFKGLSASELPQAMKQLGLSSSEQISLMQVLSDNVGLVEQRQLAAAQAMKQGTSLSKESNKRNKTLGASIDKLRRSFEILLLRLGEAIGEGLQPFIDSMTAGIKVVTRFVASPFGREVIKWTTSIIGATAAVLALHKGLGMVGVAFKMMSRQAAMAMVSLAPIMLVLAPLIALVALIHQANQAFSEFDGTVKSGFGGFLQKTGAIIAAIQEIWSSWDSVNQEFSLSKGLVDKLTKLGVLDLALAIGTWVVRIKEFLMGMVEGFKEAFKAVMDFIEPVLDAIGKALESIGISMGKNTSATDKWRKAGKIAGMVLLGILAAVTLAFVMMGITALLAMIPIILVMGLIGLATWAVIKAVGWLIEKLSAMWDWVGGMVSIGQQIVLNIWEGIASVWDKFVSWFMGAIEAVPGLGLAISMFQDEEKKSPASTLASMGINNEEDARNAINEGLAAGTFSQQDVDSALNRFGMDNSVLNSSLGARKSSAGGGGTANVTMNPAPVIINMDGDKVGEAVVRYQQEQNSRE